MFKEAPAWKVWVHQHRLHGLWTACLAYFCGIRQVICGPTLSSGSAFKDPGKHERRERGGGYSSPTTAAHQNREPGGGGTPRWNAVQVFFCVL